MPRGPPLREEKTKEAKRLQPVISTCGAQLRDMPSCVVSCRQVESSSFCWNRLVPTVLYYGTVQAGVVYAAPIVVAITQTK